jgi:hypothetical protein
MNRPETRQFLTVHGIIRRRAAMTIRTVFLVLLDGPVSSRITGKRMRKGRKMALVRDKRARRAPIPAALRADGFSR